MTFTVACVGTGEQSLPGQMFPIGTLILVSDPTYEWQGFEFTENETYLLELIEVWGDCKIVYKFQIVNHETTITIASAYFTGEQTMDTYEVSKNKHNKEQFA